MMASYGALDHARPLVGGIVAAAPREVTLWFAPHPRQLPALLTVQRSKDFCCQAVWA